MVVAGSGVDEIRFFDAETTMKPYAVIQELKGTVYNVDFSNRGNLLAAACSNGKVPIFEIVV